MQALLDPASFEFVARYFLAGFIILTVRARYIIGRRPKAAELLAEAVVLSLINQAVVIVLSVVASASGLTASERLNAALGTEGERIMLILEVLILPTLLGIAAGIAMHRNWQNALVRRLSMPVLHPAQKAYDFAFAVNRPPGYVILKFQNGTTIYGFFGENSLAASDEKRGDLYLERLYDVDECGQWLDPTPPKSAWINLDGIRSVEFLEGDA